MRTLRPPPLKHLRAFCVAARCGSFKFAADELCVTPSAVSHQMRQLESTLGLQLFERRTRRLVLTSTARRLRAEVEPLLAALERSVRELTHPAAGPGPPRSLKPRG